MKPELELPEDVPEPDPELELPPPPSPPATAAELPAAAVVDDDEELVPVPTVSPTAPLTAAIVPASGARSFVAASARSALRTLSFALSTAAVADAIEVPLLALLALPLLLAPAAGAAERLALAGAAGVVAVLAFGVAAAFGVVVAGAGVVAVVVAGAGVVAAGCGVVAAGTSCAARAAVSLAVSEIVRIVACVAGALTVEAPPACALTSVSCADWSVAFASARSTSALLGSIFASSAPWLTCSPALT
jgi:hypothetical protein